MGGQTREVEVEHRVERPVTQFEVEKTPIVVVIEYGFRLESGRVEVASLQSLTQL